MSRIVLNEKGCEFEIKSIDYERWASEADLAVVKMSPYGELPVLTERDLFLYDVYVVNEYIDERFPHPQLMPSDPVGRARTRLFLHVLARELFPHVRTLENSAAPAEKKAHARKRLSESLGVLAYRVGDTKFLLSDEFGMLMWCLLRFCGVCLSGALSFRLRRLSLKFMRSAFSLVSPLSIR